MKINKTVAFAARKGFTLVELLVVIAIIAALAGLSYGPIMKQLNAADRTEAISNARSINTALLSFYAANGQQYPNQNTNLGTALATASDGFQLLINQGIVDDEKFFWNVQNGRLLNNPIEPISDGTLNPIENVWGYVENLNAGDGGSPIFYDSVVGGTGNVFSAATWDGKAIIARVDGSVTAEQITLQPGPIQDPNTGNYQTGQVAAENGSLDVLAIGPSVGLGGRIVDAR